MRIVTAALIQNFRGKAQNATGAIQTCGGARSGVEAAVHTMWGIFDDSTTECVLFVDADNAFNRLKRQAELHNISFICPENSTLLNNVYKSPTPFYTKQNVIVSREATTQRDVAAMQIHSIATKPMVYEDKTNTKKSFFADDGAGAGKLETVREWWTSLLAQGPKFGYFPNASKTILLVKSEHYSGPFKSLQISAASGVNVTTDATKNLGGYVGPRETCDQLTKGIVGTLITHLEKLSELAKAEPHAAYSYFVSRFQQTYTYVQRFTPPSEQLWKPLEETIRNKFITALLRCDISGELRQVLQLLVKMGKMGIHDPTDTAITNYAASRKVCAPHNHLLLHQHQEYPEDMPQIQKQEREEIRQEKEAHQKALRVTL